MSKEKNVELENKNKAAEAAMLAIQKKYGVGSIRKLGDASDDVPSLSTGVFPLDMAIGIGGLPEGKIVEIYGPESAGKTLITLCAIAETQKNGGLCAFIDAEHSLNIPFAKNVGVDVDSLLFAQPDNGEQTFEIIEDLICSGAISLIVVDSVAALTPKAEIEGEMTDQLVGIQARMMSKGLRKITGLASKNNTTVVFINQLREKVGVIYGSPEVTTGGKALKFYSTLRMDVRKKEQIKNGTEVVGNKIKVKIVKNKVAAPFKEAEFDLLFASGVDNYGCIVDIAIKCGIIEKAGAWYNYKDGLIHCQGRDKTIAFLKEHEDVKQEIFELITDALRS